VPEPSGFEVKMNTEKLKRHKSPGTDHIPAELIKSGARKIIISLLLYLFGIRRNCLRSGISQSFYLYFLFITRAIKQNVVIIQAYHFCRLCTKCYPASCCESQPHMQRKFWGIISVNFNATVNLLIIFLYSLNT
jgi:hypothetical protein